MSKPFIQSNVPTHRTMYFKDILITDILNKTAFYTTFQPGMNVVTSSENHVGKSSILKSLYYALGAEVRFDDRWDKNVKLIVVTFAVDGEEYRVARYLKKYAVFKSIGKRLKLILLTSSITKELAPCLEKIFDFSVYLMEKKQGQGNDSKIIQAPPAFTFMPYFIDQDKGWSELYGSFQNVEQFTKPERAKTVYYHLGLYTRSRMKLHMKKDKLTNELKKLDKRKEDSLVIIKALSQKANYLLPVDTIEELKQQMKIPKEEIEEMVQKIGTIRNNIQKLQTSLQEHEYQLELIKKYQKAHLLENNDKNMQNTKIHVCPRCGFELDDALNALIRKKYNQSNEEYLFDQVNLIILNLKNELRSQGETYIGLVRELKRKEVVYSESQKPYEIYLCSKGLRETLQQYQQELGKIESDISIRANEIKEINKDLRTAAGKKEVEGKYKEYVVRILQHLGAWNSIYDKKIKLTQEIKAQGSLMPKIIISQFIGLFQTIDSVNSLATRFPFVVDSPRSFESSDRSSTEILNVITKSIKYVPQVILATVDYDKFEIQSNAEVHEIVLENQFHLLSKEIYSKKKEEIDEFYNMLNRVE